MLSFVNYKCLLKTKLLDSGICLNKILNKHIFFTALLCSGQHFQNNDLVFFLSMQGACVRSLFDFEKGLFRENFWKISSSLGVTAVSWHKQDKNCQYINNTFWVTRKGRYCSGLPKCWQNKWRHLCVSFLSVVLSGGEISMHGFFCEDN